MKKITQKDFFELQEVKAAQEIEKRNPFGSPNHRNAHIKILNLAERFGVVKYFESLEMYDESIIAIAHLG